MSIAEKLKRLAGILPGIRGYQGGEASRDTDKAVRLKLSLQIGELKLEVESEKRRCMERNDLSLLPALDTIASKMDKTANLIKYAERGYSGIFDINRVDQDKLDRLYSFDLALFDDIDNLREALQSLHGSSSDPKVLEEAVRTLDQAIDVLGKKFSGRSDLLTSR